MQQLFNNLIFRLSLYYLLFGLFWIFATDQILHLTFENPNAITHLQSMKGVLYVFGSAIFIFLVAFREYKSKLLYISKLEETNSYYSTLAQSIEQLDVLVIDPDLKYLYAFGNEMANMGYSANKILGQKATDLLPDTAPAREVLNIYRRTINGEYVQKELLIRGAWFDIKGTPVRNKKGQVIAGMILTTNITKHKSQQEIIDRARLQAEENEKKYTLLFEHLNEAVILQLLEKGYQPGKIVEANKAALDLLEYSKDELTSMAGHDFIRKNEIDISPDSIEKGIKSGGFTKNTRLKNKFNTWIDVKLKGAFIDYFGQSAVILMITDNRDVVKYENELIREKEKAVESDQLKSAFLANMSHEIRTPLNAILGFADLATSPGLKEEERLEYNKYIRRNSDQLLMIINDILDISKIETGQVKYSEEEFSITSAIKNCENTLKTYIVNLDKNISVNTDVSKELNNLRALSDKYKIDQLLNILGTNAVKYTDEGSITIRCRKTDDFYLEFCVEDTGYGIPRDKFDIIFERFRQLDFKNTRKYGGTGLGLSIARGIIGKLNGEIYLESEVGKGSAFYFKIPLKIAGN